MSLKSCLAGISAGCAFFLFGCSDSPVLKSLPDKKIADSKGSCNIDAQKRDGDVVEVSGWVFGNLKDAPIGYALKVETQGNSKSYYSNDFVERPDVAAFFKNPKLSKTGFTAKIPSNDSPAGSKLLLVAETDKKNYLCRESFILE